jgi:hypothetical protein
MGTSITNSLGTALSDLVTGTMSVKDAFASMAKSILKTMADLAAQLVVSAVIKFLLSALGGVGGLGGGVGLNIGGMIFGGLFAKGGNLGAGKWGIAGEAGPEIIKGPASVVPLDRVTRGSGSSMASGQKEAAAPMNVTVNNYAGAEVKTRRSGDGRLEIDILKREMANEIARGGGILSDAIERGYGLRRAGR